MYENGQGHLRLFCIVFVWLRGRRKSHSKTPWFMYQNRLGPSGGIYYPNFVPCFVVVQLNCRHPMTKSDFLYFYDYDHFFSFSQRSVTTPKPVEWELTTNCEWVRNPLVVIQNTAKFEFHQTATSVQKMPKNTTDTQK